MVRLLQLPCRYGLIFIAKVEPLPSAVVLIRAVSRGQRIEPCMCIFIGF